MIGLVREEIGDVLRDYRIEHGVTLREISRRSSVALSYLSEIERGHKEASSEILASIAEALDIPLSQILREASIRMSVSEGMEILEMKVLT